MLRGILGLSAVTAASRGLSSLSILLLALWLPPQAFGYWAAASSTMALVFALSNFGQVTSYLSGHGSDFTTTRRSIFRLNSLLALVGLMLAGTYFIAGNVEAGVLAVTIALSLPLVGDTDLLYAAAIRHKRTGILISSQVSAAALKLAVGVGIAAATGSVLALAAANITYFFVIELALGRTIARVAREAEPRHESTAPMRHKFSWAVNSYFMTLPVQSIFFAAQFFAEPEVLGVFFLAYQATLAISSVLAGPLSQVALNSFASAKDASRYHVLSWLAAFFGSCLLGAAAVAGLLLPLLESVVASEWKVALPVAVILMASLPLRIASPLLDAFQQAENKWWQSTSFNALDTGLTVLAALSAISGSALVMAIALSCSKLIIGTIRAMIVLRDARLGTRIWFVLPPIAGSILVMAGVVVGSVGGAVLLASAVAVAAAWATSSVLAQRRAARVLTLRGSA